jgi:hypothetical protein
MEAGAARERVETPPLNRIWMAIRLFSRWWERAHFIVPPASDPSVTLGNLMSLGGALVATFTVTVATGKYVFLIGREFPGKMAAANITNPSSGVLGNVYGEVCSDTVSVDASLIRSHR